MGARTRAVLLAALAGAMLAGSCRQILGVGDVTFTGGAGGAGGAGGFGGNGGATSTSSTGTTGTGGAPCVEGAMRDCYTGVPMSTEGVGPCKGGMQECFDGTFAPCEGQVTPQPEDCATAMMDGGVDADLDTNCDGTVTMCTGATVWAEAFGAADSDFINAVAIDSHGNVIVTGGFSDTVNFADPTSTPVNAIANPDENPDIFVAKYSSTGKLMWVQAYGGMGEDTGTGVAVDVNDDIVVVGFFQTSVNFGGSTVMTSDYDAFVLKLDGVHGSTIWSNTYGDAMPMATNMNVHKAYAVAVGQGGTADAGGTGGNIAVVGTFTNSISFGGSATLSNGNAGDFDGWVLELDGSGNYQWSQQVHGDAEQFDALRGVTYDSSGNVVVTGIGTTNTGNGVMSFGGTLTATPTPAPPGGGGNHVLVGKYDSEGTPQWGLALGNDDPPGGTDVPRHMGNGIAADANGNIVVTGALGSAIQFPTGAGTGTMLMPGGLTDIFVAKLDPAGNATWSASFGGMDTDTDTGNAVALDQFGNVVIVGSFQHMLTVGATALNANGATEPFAAKLDPTGKPLWAQDFAANSGSAAAAQGVALVQEPTYVSGASAGDPFIGGEFGEKQGDTISFGLTSPLSSNGASDMFLAHLAP